jgi:hypothetical protein
MSSVLPRSTIYPQSFQSPPPIYQPPPPIHPNPASIQASRHQASRSRPLESEILIYRGSGIQSGGTEHYRAAQGGTGCQALWPRNLSKSIENHEIPCKSYIIYSKIPNEKCTHRFRRGGEPPSGHGCVNGFPPEPSMGGTHQVRSLPTKTSMAWSPLLGHGLLIECFQDTRNEIHAPSPQPAHKKTAHSWVNGCPRQPGKWIYAPSPQPAHKKKGGEEWAGRGRVPGRESA